MSATGGDGPGDAGRPHVDRALLALAREDWPAAADAYVAASYATFAGYEGFGRGGFAERTEAGVAVAHLVRAAVCHRIAGANERARTRVAQGALVAADVRDHVATDPVDAAGAAELVGVCRVLEGDDAAAAAAFDDAEARYEAAAVDDPAGATTNPLQQAGTNLLTHLSRPNDVAWDDVHGTGANALDRRVRYLRARTADLVDARVDAGKLHAPRASTEYGTDRECPSCGATDVNYHSPAILCLRCSGVVERR